MTEQQPVRNINDLIAQNAIPAVEKIFGQDEKNQLAEAGTPFIVNSIAMGNDEQYGPYWQVEALLDNQPISFRLSQHERRDAFMSGVAGALASGPIGGLRLKAYTGRGGNAFITLEPAV